MIKVFSLLFNLTVALIAGTHGRSGKFSHCFCLLLLLFKSVYFPFPFTSRFLLALYGYSRWICTTTSYREGETRSTPYFRFSPAGFFFCLLVRMPQLIQAPCKPEAVKRILLCYLSKFSFHWSSLRCYFCFGTLDHTRTHTETLGLLQVTLLYFHRPRMCAVQYIRIVDCSIYNC